VRKNAWPKHDGVQQQADTQEDLPLVSLPRGFLASAVGIVVDPLQDLNATAFCVDLDHSRAFSSMILSF
jgi:hypothetical protein